MKKRLVLVSTFAITLCVLISHGPTWARPASGLSWLFPQKQAVTQPESDTDAGNLVTRACALIYQSKFTEAHDLLKGNKSAEMAEHVSSLQAIISEYQVIVSNRIEARHAAFLEQLDELEKVQHPDPNDPNDLGDAEAPHAMGEDDEPLEPNATAEDRAVKRLIKSLSIIAKASEYADNGQRQDLFENAYVCQTLEQAIERASNYEAEGQWIDAYSECYAWLKVIDPNNEGYSDYAEELWDKVAIDSSFTDSPCETSAQRYEGVRKEIFKYAIRVLNLYYVSSIDFGEMATQALNRCKLLVEVVSMRAIDPNDSVDYEKPQSKELTAWIVSLDALLDEVAESSTGLSMRAFLSTFEHALDLNRATVELPEAIVVAQFTEAALDSLDPHTAVIWPRQVKEFNKAMTNEFTGVGIEISKQKGVLTVASLLPDTPAYKAGLDAGDVIEIVDGIATKDMSLHCAVQKITGPKGTPVTLTVKRAETDKRDEITIVRDRIIVPTVRGWLRTEGGKWLHMIDPKERIGYARLTSFSGETAADFETILNELEDDGLNGLILDLRSNSGGLLTSAVAISDMFIKKGLIVRTQPGFGSLPDYKTAKERTTHPNYPLVVLVNSASASASEIVAGALADDKYERAVLVGDRTHGKGSVQIIVQEPTYGAHIKYTMAHYYLPSGQRVNSRKAREKLSKRDWGVTPDVAISLRSDELKDLYDLQKENSVLVQANHVRTNGALNKHSIEETLKADAQLAVARLIVRTKQIEAASQVVTVAFH